MPLSHFAVVNERVEPLNRVLIHCLDDRQMVLVFISREAIDDYFHLSSLTPRDRSLLIDRKLGHLILVIATKYDCGEVGEYIWSGAQRFPQIDLDLCDLEAAPEKLTDTVLDVAARAGFKRHQKCRTCNGPPVQRRQGHRRRSLAHRGARSRSALKMRVGRIDWPYWGLATLRPSTAACQ